MGLKTWQKYTVALFWASKGLCCCFWPGGRHEVSRKKFTHMDARHPRRKYGKIHERERVCVCVCACLGAIREND